MTMKIEFDIYSQPKGALYIRARNLDGLTTYLDKNHTGSIKSHLRNVLRAYVETELGKTCKEISVKVSGKRSTHAYRLDASAEITFE